MAKKDNEAVYQEFLASLRSAVGDDKWTAVEEALIKNEKASDQLKSGVLARSEFSRSMDALSTERKQFEDHIAEANRRIEGWKDWYGNVTQEVSKVQGELKTYKDTYGELDGRPAPKGVSEAEFNKRLQEEIGRRDAANLKFLADFNKVTSDFNRRFPKDSLDLEAVYKIAGEQQIDLNRAYQTHIADRVEEQRKSEYETAIKAAREEGAKEALSKHNLPTVSSAPSMVHSLDAQNVPTNSRDRIAAAVADFNTRSR